ncbi:aspartate aminotransferase family protein [Sphingomonas sp. CCH18-H6]|uniref:aspartate aminotransferase family protein n=1 Tax=Sphingomonas sp. CCH18-H6 TaxID=1768787 RepID=UPI0008313FB4|nr:aspartate aminotransferase family protein [Sphingomonas sp. CCH18-H6]
MSSSATRSIRSRDAQVIANIGRLRFSPLAPIRGEGVHLVDESGRRILDLSSSGCPAVLGYGHPEIVQAVEDAARSMAGASLLLYPNEHAVGLAEDLLRLTPGTGKRRVWFGHSGSDANDCAVRVLQAATRRSRFISFIGSYHGNVSGSMAVSGHTAMTHTLPRPGLVLLPYPDSYRGEFSAEQVLQLLDYQFATTCPPDQVAAVFMEPLMSDGGIIVPPPGFLAAVQERCRAHGIRVVVDEVKVGLGRTGLWHCFEHEGLEPDLVIFGKALGGGLPISAVVGAADILDHAPAFALQTTAGNPVASAAARAVLRVCERDRLPHAAARLGAQLQAGLRDLARTETMIGDVRGRGLAVGVELVADRAEKAPVPVTTTAKVIFRAYELGAAFIYVGLRGNVLELTPPLTISPAQLDEGVAIIAQAILDVREGVVSDEQVAPFMMW